MNNFIYEDTSGVCLSLAYVRDEKGLLFLDAHVLDADYHPVGPNIAPLLQKLSFITDCLPDGSFLMKPFFSSVANEIGNSSESTR